MTHVNDRFMTSKSLTIEPVLRPCVETYLGVYMTTAPFEKQAALSFFSSSGRAHLEQRWMHVRGRRPGAEGYGM